MTKLEFTLTRLPGAPPAASLPSLATPSRSAPPPPTARRPAVVPPSENEDSPAVIFYGPNGKPITKSQVERKMQMLRNKEQQGSLFPPARLGPRNRQILRDFPGSRSMLPRNRAGRFSAQ